MIVAYLVSLTKVCDNRVHTSQCNEISVNTLISLYMGGNDLLEVKHHYVFIGLVVVFPDHREDLFGDRAYVSQDLLTLTLHGERLFHLEIVI